MEFAQPGAGVKSKLLAELKIINPPGGAGLRNG